MTDSVTRRFAGTVVLPESSGRSAYEDARDSVDGFFFVTCPSSETRRLSQRQRHAEARRFLAVLGPEKCVPYTIYEQAFVNKGTIRGRGGLRQEEAISISFLSLR